MSTITVSNPKIPFVGLIPGTAKPGKIFTINGHTDKTGDHCVINLQKTPSSNSNKTLHISIRPRDQVIVRNHYLHGWGIEERYGGCPIGLNEPFQVMILVKEKHFKIAVNGRHFCVFKHRLPLDEGRYVGAEGACTIQSITGENEISQTSEVPLSSTVTTTHHHYHHHYHYHYNQMEYAPSSNPMFAPNFSAGAQDVGFKASTFPGNQQKRTVYPSTSRTSESDDE